MEGQRPKKKTPGRGLMSSMAKANPKKSKHLIDDISYSQDWIVCTCAWKGSIDVYQAHRKEMEPS